MSTELLTPITQLPGAPPGCGNEAALREIRERIAALEHALNMVNTAFVRDDLGRPGYDSHRLGHKAEAEARSRMEGYKQDGAKKIIALVIGAMALVFVLGLSAWFKGHAP